MASARTGTKPRIKAKVRLHLTDHKFRRGPESLPDFYRGILSGLQSLGAEVEILTRSRDALAEPAPEGHFDFVNAWLDAPFPPRQRVLHLGKCYVPGFNYLDPLGINFASSITGKTFYPKQVDQTRAQAFLRDLQRRFVLTRQSRRPQQNEVQHFGSGHLAIFLQDWSNPVERAQYMDTLAMVRAVVEGAGGRQILVKPHPLHEGRETREVLRYLKGRPGVTVTKANVHDILSGAAATISICSSLAMEGMLHRVPAILFGRSDVHHCATTVTRPEDFPAALQQALTRTWPFARYLLWFLRWQNVDASLPLLPKVLDRMQTQGADFSALGITRPVQG